MRSVSNHKFLRVSFRKGMREKKVKNAFDLFEVTKDSLWLFVPRKDATTIPT